MFDVWFLDLEFWFLFLNFGSGAVLCSAFRFLDQFLALGVAQLRRRSATEHWANASRPCTLAVALTTRGAGDGEKRGDCRSSD